MTKKAIPRSSLPFKIDFNQVFGKIHVSSVLKDMIYVVLFLVIFTLLLAFLKVSAWIIIISFGILIVILIFFAYCFNYLMKNNPDLLRSETYQLQKQQIEMMGSKGQESPAEVIEAEAIIEKPKEERQEQLKKGGSKK